jgi:hypothetical protein
MSNSAVVVLLLHGFALHSILETAEKNREYNMATGVASHPPSPILFDDK